MRVTLCRSCPLGAEDFAETLRAALPADGPRIAIGSADCMSGSARPSTLAVWCAGKTAYLFGELTAADLPDLLSFLRLYAASADGDFPDARALGALRQKAIARIPG